MPMVNDYFLAIGILEGVMVTGSFHAAIRHGDIMTNDEKQIRIEPGGLAECQ